MDSGNDLLMPRCLATLITAIHFGLALQTPTSVNLHVFRINWPVLWQSHHHYSQCSNAAFPSKSVYWPINQFMKTQPVYQQPVLSISLIPFLEKIFGNHYQFPGSRPRQWQGHFTLVPQHCGTGSHYQSTQPPILQLLKTSEKLMFNSVFSSRLPTYSTTC